jgi:hypothetical protein
VLFLSITAATIFCRTSKDQIVRKPRLNAYISCKVNKRLSEVASRPGVSKAAIVDAALAAFLDPDDEDRRDAAILKRLDRIDARLDRLEQDLTITSETLALFIRYMLTVTPPVPERDRSALQAKGRDRFAQFIEQVTKRIASGTSLAEEVIGSKSTKLMLLQVQIRVPILVLRDDINRNTTAGLRRHWMSKDRCLWALSAVNQSPALTEGSDE